MKTILNTKLVKILKGKCPNCENGYVFKKNDKFVFQIPKMEKCCNNCGHVFEREPGYFFGALYVSYGLTVFQGLTIFLICNFLIGDMPFPAIIGAITVFMVLMSSINYKLSRVIWITIFP